MLFLRTFGGLELDKNGNDLGAVAQQRGRLAVLAVLAAATDRGVSRDRLQALFWPESDSARARNALNQALYALRRGLANENEELTLGTTELQLNPAVIQTDVGTFARLIESGALADAVALYRGAFLDGIHIKEAPDFDRWMDAERGRLAELYRLTLERLAEEARVAGNAAAAVGWWRRRMEAEPHSARVALKFMESLANAGDREAAIHHAGVYDALVRSELDAAPAPEIEEFARTLRGRQAAPARPSKKLDQMVVASKADAPLLRPSRWTARKRIGVVVGLLTAVSLYLGGHLYAAHRDAKPFMSSTEREGSVAFPFRVDIADSSLAFLGEGIADLLNAALAQQGSAPTADAHSLAAAWREAGAQTRDPIEVAVRATQRVGGRRAIVGTVVGNRLHISLSAEVISTSGRVLGSPVSANGSPDSLLAIVDRLAAALLAGEATADEHRLSDLTTRSPRALREYLTGLAAMRMGQIHSARTAFGAALRIDSSFALAALGIATSGGWADETLSQRMGKDFALGWRLRPRLSPSDRALFDAAVGTHNPTDDSDAASLDRWGRAAQLLPARGDVSYEYGDRLFHVGNYLGVPDADGQASRAFAFAVAADSSQLVALGHLVELAIYRGDSASVRRLHRAYALRDSVGDAADYLTWRVALATGDSTSLRSLRARLPALSRLSLRRISGMGQLDGIGLVDAELAMMALANRDMTPHDQARTLYRRHALDLNRGRLGAAAERLEELGSLAIGSADEASSLGDALDLAVIDALFSVGDLGRAERAVSLLEQSPGSRNDGTAQRHACTSDVWRVSHGDTSRTAATLQLLSAHDAHADSAEYYGWQPRICIALLQAARTVARRPEANDLLTRADSLMAAGVRGYGATFGNLWLARLYGQIGDRTRALRAASRRRRDWDSGVLYVADADAIIVTLARATGDSLRADRVAAQYKSLRGGLPRVLSR